MKRSFCKENSRIRSSRIQSFWAVKHQYIFPIGC